MTGIRFRMTEEQHAALAEAAAANHRSIQKEIEHRVFGARDDSHRAATIRQADELLGDSDFSAPRGGVRIQSGKRFSGPDLKPVSKPKATRR
jgi:hypothetical protein